MTKLPFTYKIFGQPYFGHIKPQHLEFLNNFPEPNSELFDGGRSLAKKIGKSFKSIVDGIEKDLEDNANNKENKK